MTALFFSPKFRHMEWSPSVSCLLWGCTQAQYDVPEQMFLHKSTAVYQTLYYTCSNTPSEAIAAPRLQMPQNQLPPQSVRQGAHHTNTAGRTYARASAVI